MLAFVRHASHRQSTVIDDGTRVALKKVYDFNGYGDACARGGASGDADSAGADDLNVIVVIPREDLCDVGADEADARIPKGERPVMVDDELEFVAVFQIERTHEVLFLQGQ